VHADEMRHRLNEVAGVELAEIGVVLAVDAERRQNGDAEAARHIGFDDFDIAGPITTSGVSPARSKLLDAFDREIARDESASRTPPCPRGHAFDGALAEARRILLLPVVFIVVFAGGKKVIETPVAINATENDTAPS
jgi:hypothetical protein